MGNTNYTEKRSHARTPIKAPVIYTMDHNDDEPCSGTSQNLSSSGIYITTAHAPKLNTDIRIVLSSNDKHSAPMVIEGKVVRCKFDKKNPDLFHVSIEFSEIHEACVQIITSN